MSIESDSTIKINQPSATQNAARKGDETEGTDPAGIAGGTVTTTVTTSSPTVFIGDNGATSLATPPFRQS